MWWDDQRRLWGDNTPLREPAVVAVLSLLACALGPLTREAILQLVPPDLGLNLDIGGDPPASYTFHHRGCYPYWFYVQPS